MKVEITKQEKNTLLGRTELRGVVTFEGVTPSRQQVRQSLAAHVKVKPALVVVKRLLGAYGSQRAVVEAVTYDDPKWLDMIEPAFVKKRNAKEEKPAEEKPAEAPAAEGGADTAPAEKKKEEKAEEKKDDAAEKKPEEKPTVEKKEDAGDAAKEPAPEKAEGDA